MQPRPRQDGIALITVLWLLLLLSVIATGALREARTETNLARNATEAAEAGALAEAGLQRALLALSGDGIEAGWRSDGMPRVWSFAGRRIEITIQDEAGRIDLNRAPVALLDGLLRAAGQTPARAAALADAIADYRDRNDLRRLKGAEDDDYRAAGLPWGAKDAPFDRVAELGRVIGMTPNLLARLIPAVTVYCRQSGIDPATAPRAALLALPGIDPVEVETFLRRRAQSERAPGPIATAPEAFIADGRQGRVFEIRAKLLGTDGSAAVRRAIVRRTQSAGVSIEVWGDSQI